MLSPVIGSPPPPSSLDHPRPRDPFARARNQFGCYLKTSLLGLPSYVYSINYDPNGINILAKKIILDCRAATSCALFNLYIIKMFLFQHNRSGGRGDELIDNSTLYNVCIVNDNVKILMS